MTVKVKFVSKIESAENENLLKIVKDARVKLKTSCDGKGKCGKCLIKPISGKLSSPTKKEIKTLGEDKINEGYRLACQTSIIDGEVVIEVINNNSDKIK